MEIIQINKQQASEFIALYHYRKIMPKLNKVFYGGFIEDRIVAVITFGWGTQPLNTIKKMFPSLVSNDYFEIGRLCLLDELPRNSESEFMSKVFNLLKNDYPNLKVIFSWSDGIMGKPGFVYQASNFWYAGKITTDVYITKEGYLIHPRSAKKLLEVNAKYIGREKLCWLTNDFLKLNSIIRLKGYQFKYLMFLTGHKETKSLIKEAICPINKEYPKMKDIKFFTMDYDTGKYKESVFPNYKETLNAGEVSRVIQVDSINQGLVQFQNPAHYQLTLPS